MSNHNSGHKKKFDESDYKEIGKNLVDGFLSVFSSVASIGADVAETVDENSDSHKTGYRAGSQGVGFYYKSVKIDDE